MHSGCARRSRRRSRVARTDSASTHQTSGPGHVSRNGLGREPGRHRPALRRSCCISGFSRTSRLIRAARRDLPLDGHDADSGQLSCLARSAGPHPVAHPQATGILEGAAGLFRLRLCVSNHHFQPAEAGLAGASSPSPTLPRCSSAIPHPRRESKLSHLRRFIRLFIALNLFLAINGLMQVYLGAGFGPGRGNGHRRGHTHSGHWHLQRSQRSRDDAGDDRAVPDGLGVRPWHTFLPSAPECAGPRHGVDLPATGPTREEPSWELEWCSPPSRIAVTDWPRHRCLPWLVLSASWRWDRRGCPRCPRMRIRRRGESSRGRRACRCSRDLRCGESVTGSTRTTRASLPTTRLSTFSASSVCLGRFPSSACFTRSFKE